MNFLDTPLSYTRSSRLSQTPAEYAPSIERPVRTSPQPLRAAAFLIVAAILVIAALS